MATVAMSGNDTVSINDHVFADLADGDAVTLEFENDLANIKTGKNGNSIYSFNETGKQATVKLRVIRASADDKFLVGLLSNFKQNPAGFILMFGEFIKKIGNGLGAIAGDTYIMSGGVFTKEVNAKSNAEGDTDQSVAEWTIKFTNAPRVIT